MPPSPAASGFRIDRLAPSEAANRAAWLAALASFDPASAVVIKRDGDAAVYRATLRSRDIIAKVWTLRSTLARLKHFLRASRGHRHWKNAAWLRAHGIATAECLVLATDRAGSAPRQWLIMEALPGKTVLQHLADNDLSIRQQHAVAAALGEQVARLMQLRHYNRDPKPSNQIVTGFAHDSPPDHARIRARVAVIDCVAIRRDIWFDSDEPYPMLARLIIEAIGVGHPPRRALMMRALRAYMDFWERAQREAGRRPLGAEARKHAWREIAQLVRNHGDPAPAVHPLAAAPPGAKRE